jgi:hypothetical protein
MFQWFLKLEGISMNCNFKIAHGVAASQIADRVAGEKQDHLRLAGSLAQLPQGMLLIGREPVFQKVNVIGHVFFLLPACSASAPCLRAQVTHVVTVTLRPAEAAKQYIITNVFAWLAYIAPEMQLDRGAIRKRSFKAPASHRQPCAKDWAALQIGLRSEPHPCDNPLAWPHCANP